MNLKNILLFVLAGLAGASWAQAAAVNAQVAPNVVDESADVSRDAEWLKSLQATLVKFDSQHGIKVLVQFHANPPPDAEDQHPGDYMRALATKLGVIQSGILMVHFAGDPDWRVWIGDDLTPKFVGKPGTAKEFTDDGAMHEAKEAMLTAAIAGASQKYNSIPGLPRADPKLAADGILLRLQTDAIVEGLKAKFWK